MGPALVPPVGPAVSDRSGLHEKRRDVMHRCVLFAAIPVVLSVAAVNAGQFGLDF